MRLALRFAVWKRQSQKANLLSPCWQPGFTLADHRSGLLHLAPGVSQRASLSCMQQLERLQTLQLVYAHMHSHTTIKANHTVLCRETPSKALQACAAPPRPVGAQILQLQRHILHHQRHCHPPCHQQRPQLLCLFLHQPHRRTPQGCQSPVPCSSLLTLHPRQRRVHNRRPTRLRLCQ